MVTTSMLWGLQQIDHARRHGGPTTARGVRMRYAWWSLNGLTRAALVRRGLVEKRDDTTPRELFITPKGFGVLDGARAEAERARREQRRMF